VRSAVPSAIAGVLIAARGPDAEALSLNPWMGDFVWSLTRFS
jgi:hypothetical protein